MSWTIVNVECLWNNIPGKLPAGKFLLSNSKVTKHANGWLPCHHRNIAYGLEFKSNGDISKITTMCTLKGKKRPKVSPKAFKKTISREVYFKKADIAYRDTATWTIAVLYPYWMIISMDIPSTFQLLCQNPEHLCCRNSSISIPDLYYNKERALCAINIALCMMSEKPFSDIIGFNERMDWQLQTKYNTASHQKPGLCVHNIQKYQNKWTTQEEIDIAKLIGCAIQKDNCELQLGSPYNVDGVIVVKTLEDAYRIQCYVDSPDIAMLTLPGDESRRKEMGLSNITLLKPCQTVCIPWAHTWGLQDWLQLIKRTPIHYTCIGRFDQYSKGRGQLFQNMFDAKFNCTRCPHYKVSNVEMVHTTSVVEFVHSILKTHAAKVVQCFSDDKWKDIDTGRRWLRTPRRVRSLTQRNDVKHPRTALVEEEFTIAVGNNASVIPCWSYEGLPVEIGVYLCNASTKAFDVNLARTHCRYKLYIVNCTSCLFSWEHKASKRNTINPFL